MMPARLAAGLTQGTFTRDRFRTVPRLTSFRYPGRPVLLPGRGARRSAASTGQWPTPALPRLVPAGSARDTGPPACYG
jgi:hypothetical protein